MTSTGTLSQLLRHKKHSEKAHAYLSSALDAETTQCNPSLALEYYRKGLVEITSALQLQLSRTDQAHVSELNSKLKRNASMAQERIKELSVQQTQGLLCLVLLFLSRRPS